MSFFSGLRARAEQQIAAIKESAASVSLDSLRERMTTAAALDDIVAVKISDRIWTMPFPVHPDSSITKGNDAQVLPVWIKKFCGDPTSVLVLNISEVVYSPEVLGGAPVVTVAFPGYPAPPLGAAVKLIRAASDWLDSDTGNHVIIHCTVRV